MIRKLLDNRIVKNAGWLICGRVARMMITLVVGLLTARYLGPSNNGLLNYANAYVVFVTCFCTLGTNSVLVKEFMDAPQKEGEILGTTLLLRAASSFLSALVIVGIVCVVNRDEPTTIAVVAASSIGMVFHIFESLDYWFQSRLQSKVTAMVTLIAYAITSAYRVVLLVMGADVLWFAFASSLEYVSMGTLLILAYRRNHGSKFTFSAAYAKALLRKSCHFILPGLMVAIYGQTDKIMLKQMMDDAAVGYYSTASSLSIVWCFVLSAIIDSMIPSIMSAHKTDHKEFVKRNKQLYAIVFYLSLFVSLCFTLLADVLISVMYGQAYMPSAPVLRIVTWCTAFSYLGVARGAWLVCEGKQKYLVYISAAAAVANVVLNWLLIPLWGASGAAVASVIAQFMSSIVGPFFVKPLRANSKMMIEAILLKGIRGDATGLKNASARTK